MAHRVMYTAEEVFLENQVTSSGPTQHDSSLLQGSTFSVLKFLTKWLVDIESRVSPYFYLFSYSLSK